MNFSSAVSITRMWNRGKSWKVRKRRSWGRIIYSRCVVVFGWGVSGIIWFPFYSSWTSIPVAGNGIEFFGSMMFGEDSAEKPVNSSESDAEEGISGEVSFGSSGFTC